MSPSAQAGFPVAAHRSLKRRGVSGFPRAWIEGDALRITGSAELAVPFACIEHARIGSFFGAGRTRYAAILRIAGEAEPLVLVTYRGAPEFAVAMRRVAAAVMAKKGIGAVEAGMTVGRSLLSLFFLSAFGAAVGFQIAVVFGLGPGARTALPLLGLAVTVPGWLETFRRTPRRIVSLHELDEFLPRLVPRQGQHGGLAT